jgi:hypothetical protein
MSEQKKLKQHKLKAIPEDVYRIILEKQLEHKLHCNCQFSIEQTIYKLIRLAGKKEKP